MGSVLAAVQVTEPLQAVSLRFSLPAG